MATALPDCVSTFGGSEAACPGVEEHSARLFATQSGKALTADEARTECGLLGADDLVATRWDGVWADPKGWVWTLPMVVDTGEMRVMVCGEGAK